MRITDQQLATILTKLKANKTLRYHKGKCIITESTAQNSVVVKREMHNVGCSVRIKTTFDGGIKHSIERIDCDFVVDAAVILNAVAPSDKEVNRYL